MAILRAEAGRDPYDKLLSNLVGELSTRSGEFRVRWGAHNVKFHRTGAKTLHHPLSATSASTTKRWTCRATSGNEFSYTAPNQDAPATCDHLLAGWSMTPPAHASNESAGQALTTKEN